MVAKAMQPRLGYQRSTVETVNGLGDRQLPLQRRRHHGRIVGVDHQGDSQIRKFSKVGFQANPRIA
jgi:hypothetical protein